MDVLQLFVDIEQVLLHVAFGLRVIALLLQFGLVHSHLRLFTRSHIRSLCR